MFLHTMSSYGGTVINCWSQSFGKRATYSRTEETAEFVMFICMTSVLFFLLMESKY